MTRDPLLLSGDVDDATTRLLRTAARFDATDLAQDCLLPGWTRGHLLAHLSRNADALVNALTSARTGDLVPMYPSEEARAAGIEAGAFRSPQEHLDDLRRSADRYAEAVAAMPVPAWSATVQTRRGPLPAAVLVWRRLRELEVHHVDLAAGYRPQDWSPSFAHRLLHEVVTDLGERDRVPPLVLHFDGGSHELVIGDRAQAPVVSGPTVEVAAWLTGRSPGTTLTVTPDGQLPDPPEWI
ncbi:maleylpyruvate isomerase family mycothiol-dependent enzyme [Micromonospora sp. NPDC048871]|uniref:maleylpyruvate isomerase family mycothiol-dependent enzyme n=1 Tax=unclassified Micromonospora TaxID=2617518 RepID=UPI0033E815B4